MTAAVVISFGKHYITNNEDRTGAQRELVALVHELFPKPVPYIDRGSMISAYPKQGIFMTSWGMESYHAAGRPIFEDLVRDRRPLFLIVNSPSLDPNLSRTAPGHCSRRTETRPGREIHLFLFKIVIESRAGR